jgi:hypothetical protein
LQIPFSDGRAPDICECALHDGRPSSTLRNPVHQSGIPAVIYRCPYPASDKNTDAYSSRRHMLAVNPAKAPVRKIQNMALMNCRLLTWQSLHEYDEHENIK